MSEFTPWLGICHIRQLADDSPDIQPTLAAVWANSVESFEREMHVYTNTHGVQMIWAEGVMPAKEWLAKHHGRKDGQRLASKVSAKHPVEIGGLGSGVISATAGDQLDDTEGYLHIEEIDGVEPLDSQFGVEPPKTVPDALYEPLFGQPEPTAAEVAQYGGTDKVPSLNTYAILDAVKVVNFVEMLETSGLEHRCLFKGEAAEEMRDVAPYVVRLEEGNDFTRNLFSHDPEQGVPWFMWDREPGIYIRARSSLEDMWKHFRKFTKVQDEDGEWFYFRFWEKHVLPSLVKGEAFEKAAGLLTMSDGQFQTWIFPSTKNGVFWWFSGNSEEEKQRILLPLIDITVFNALNSGTKERLENREFSQALEFVEPKQRKGFWDSFNYRALRERLIEMGFALPEQRIEAMGLYLWMTSKGSQEQAWQILTETKQGPKIRLWHLRKQFDGAK